MTHDEFKKRHGDPVPFWGITDLAKAAWLLDGRKGMIGLWGSRLLVVSPGLVFAIYCVVRHHYWELGWAILALLASGNGRTDIACSAGCVWVPAILVGILLASRGAQNLVGGLLPIASYFLSSIHRGTSVYTIGCRIAASESEYNRLNDAGVLFFVDPVTPPTDPSVPAEESGQGKG